MMRENEEKRHNPNSILSCDVKPQIVGLIMASLASPLPAQMQDFS
jgi:hypothetical protein